MPKKSKKDNNIKEVKKIVELPSKIKIIVKKDEKSIKKEETLEREIEESEAEHFSQFMPSPGNVSPIIRQASSPQSQAVELEPELSAGERAQREHERNQMTSGIGAGDISRARLYDVGRALGGNAPKNYQTGEAPAVPIIRPNLSQQSNFVRPSMGFQNEEIERLRSHDENEPRYYAGTKSESDGIREKRRLPWETDDDGRF